MDVTVVETKAFLTIDRIRKSYSAQAGSLRVLDDVSFELRPGEFLGLVGPSGSGKSTLLRLLAGLDRDYEGEIRVGGEALRGAELARGMVFQEPRLFPWLTIRQNVGMPLQEAGLSARSKAAAVAEGLNLVGLSGFEDMFPHQLSGGMQQRAAIARALVAKPRLLLLDEPFGALDAFTKVSLQSELLRIRAADPLPAIIVTHDLEEAVFLCDRVIVLSARPGRVQAIEAIDLPHPRDRTDPKFNAKRRSLLAELGLGP